MEPTDLSFATKVKIVAGMALAAALIVAITGGVVSYQRYAKAEAAALAKTQLVNLEAMRTSFPDYKNTEEFKESKKMAMVKVNQSSLPTTITAGLDPAYSPNPYCEYAPSLAGDDWRLQTPSGEITSSDGDLHGWSIAGSSVSIPSGAGYGTYTLVSTLHEVCDKAGTGDGEIVYRTVFKITPPCPTSLTVTHSP